MLVAELIILELTQENLNIRLHPCSGHFIGNGRNQLKEFEKKKKNMILDGVIIFELKQVNLNMRLQLCSQCFIGSVCNQFQEFEGPKSHVRFHEVCIT